MQKFPHAAADDCGNKGHQVGNLCRVSRFQNFAAPKPV